MKARRSHMAPAPIYARRQLAAIAERWDQKAQTWDQALQEPDCHLNEDEAYQRFLSEIRGVIDARRAFCAAHGVIDAGCGTGTVLAQVLPFFAWGAGVDLSLEMIRQAQAKSLSNARFLVGDSFQLSSLCPPAGAVVSRGILLSHYGPKQGKRLLQSARATLLPGGFAVFDFLNEAARTRYQHRPQAKTFYTAAQLLAMARHAGFSRATVLGEERRRVLLLLAEVSCSATVCALPGAMQCPLSQL